MIRKANPRLIGGFVVGAVALLVIAIVLFASGPLFKKTTKFVSYFDGSVAGLVTGAPVKFRGVTVGAVKEVRLAIREAQLDRIAEQSDDDVGRMEAELYFRIPVIYELDEDILTKQGAKVDLDDPNLTAEWIKLGMRAYLATESLVTGRKYLALDVFPGSEVELSPFTEGQPYPEIPTIKTGFEQLEAEVKAVLKKLAAVNVDSMIGSLANTLSGLEELANSPGLRQTFEEMPKAVDELTLTLRDIRGLVASVDTTMLPLRENIASAVESLDETMESFAATAKSIQNVVSPGSPIIYRLDTTLEEMDRTSKSLRALVEYLERNPSAIVRGKPKDE